MLPHGNFGQMFTTLNKDNTLALVIFGSFVVVTLGITFWASQRTKNAKEFFTADRKISAWQNGVAVAGDYMSAASFLGIAGLIAYNGFDGFMYSVGWLVAYLTVLLVVAEPLRNGGKYTMADILAYRLSAKPVRAAAAFSTLTVSTFYMIAQMVGAGALVKLLFGWDFEPAVVLIGVLMIVYVVFGGMLATTWVQIIKALLLMAGTLLISILVLAQFNFDLGKFFDNITQVRTTAIQADAKAGDTTILLNATVAAGKEIKIGPITENPGTYKVVKSEAKDKNFILTLDKPLEKDYSKLTNAGVPADFSKPGRNYKDDPANNIYGKLDLISLGLALIFGTAGLPHILVRFYTVPTARAARVSVIWAMIIIGAFYIMTTFLGFGAALLVTTPVITPNGGSNMAAPLLAQAVGGTFFFALISAVAFATILAVVAGLTITASSAIAHDFWLNIVKNGRETEGEQIMVARITAFLVGAVSIGLAIFLKTANVAYLVSLAFAVAASANLPVIIFSLFWKRFTTAGAVTGIIVGLATSIFLIVIGPNGYVSVNGAANYKEAIFPLTNPGIVSIPLGFLGAFLGTFLKKEPLAEAKFPEMFFRTSTGVGAE